MLNRKIIANFHATSHIQDRCRALMEFKNTGIKNVSNLFSFDLKKANDMQYNLTIQEIDGKNYELKLVTLNPPELDLFEELLFDIKTDSASFVFRSKGLSNRKIELARNITNKLYDLLKDKTVGGTGRFKESDLNQIKKFDYWAGKNWIDNQTQSNVMIDYSDGFLRLIINI